MSIVLGDFGRVNPAVIHGWNVDTLDFIHVTVDTSGALIVTGGGGGGSTVDQGSGGLSAWLVTGPLTDTQLRASDVKITLDGESVPVTGSFYQATQPVSLASAPSTPITNTNLDAALSTLATVARQDTGNTSLASIDGKTPALGQALAAASVPVILPSATITTLTPPAALTGFATSAKQDTGNTSLSSIDAKLTNPLPVSGTVTTGGLTDTQLRASAVPVSLASAPSTPITNANLDVALSTLATGAKQDTGNASLATIAAVGFATAAKQDTGNASLTTIAAKDFATETTLALGATAANQATEISSLASLAAEDFATETTLSAIEANQPTTLDLDGQTVAFINDPLVRRLMEQHWLDAHAAMLATLAASEPMAGRYGFEVR